MSEEEEMSGYAGAADADLVNGDTSQSALPGLNDKEPALIEPPQPIQDTMEVHHHPNLHHQPKAWKEYFLEFLMIFLAVSMGFFAENFREHLVNKEREKQYSLSFYDDLSADESHLLKLISNIQVQQIQSADSLPVLLASPVVTGPANHTYVFLRRMFRQQGVKSYITDRTFEQVKNAGEMRLISNKPVSDSLVDYYKTVDYIEDLQQTLKTYKEKLREDLPLIVRATDYARTSDSDTDETLPGPGLQLGSTDPVAINRILIATSEIGALSKLIKNRIANLRLTAGHIKKLIAKEYHVEE